MLRDARPNGELGAEPGAEPISRAPAQHPLLPELCSGQGNGGGAGGRSGQALPLVLKLEKPPGTRLPGYTSCLWALGTRQLFQVEKRVPTVLSSWGAADKRVLSSWGYRSLVAGRAAPPDPPCPLFLPQGLKTPSSCELVVGGEPQCWAEGRCLLFDDSFLHTAFHEGEPSAGPRRLLARPRQRRGSGRSGWALSLLPRRLRAGAAGWFPGVTELLLAHHACVREGERPGAPGAPSSPAQGSFPP